MCLPCLRTAVHHVSGLYTFLTCKLPRLDGSFFLGALHTPAPGWLDVDVKILFAVIIANLFPGLDSPS
jgi:hypothetical protein